MYIWLLYKGWVKKTSPIFGISLCSWNLELMFSTFIKSPISTADENNLRANRAKSVGFAFSLFLWFVCNAQHAVNFLFFWIFYLTNVLKDLFFWCKLGSMSHLLFRNIKPSKSHKKISFLKKTLFLMFSMLGITSDAHATKNAKQLKRISSAGKGMSVLVWILVWKIRFCNEIH